MCSMRNWLEMFLKFSELQFQSDHVSIIFHFSNYKRSKGKINKSYETVNTGKSPITLQFCMRGKSID